MTEYRKTVNRETIRDTANRIIAFLAAPERIEDDDNRIRIHAIRNFTESILAQDNAYFGFRYLDPPSIEVDAGNGWTRREYDETRIEYY